MCLGISSFRLVGSHNCDSRQPLVLFESLEDLLPAKLLVSMTVVKAEGRKSKISLIFENSGNFDSQSASALPEE